GANDRAPGKGGGRLRMGTRCCRPGERERGRRYGNDLQHHWLSAAWMPLRNCAAWFVIVPMMCVPTRRPLRSTKYVSGTPVNPYASPIIPEPSCTIGYVMP